MKTAVFLTSFFFASLGMAAIWALVVPAPTALDVVVIDQDDPAGTDRVTHLTLSVTNTGTQELAPVFFVPGGALMNWIAWPIEDGGPTIQPGETELIVITTPPYTGIPYGTDFRVLAYDDQGTRLGQTELVPFRVDRERPSALNPAFQYWEHQMFTDVPMPYGWVPLDRTLSESRWELAGGPGNLTMRMWPNSDRDINATFVVRQAIDFPAFLHIQMDPAMLRANGADAVVAILIEDVYAERRIDVVIIPEGQAPAPVQTGIDDAGHWVKLERNGTDLHLDVPGIFDSMGWPWPAKRIIERQETSGPGNIGFGAAATLAGNQRLEVMRPIELEFLLISRPPHSLDMLQATFHHVGGPALDPAPSRF